MRGIGIVLLLGLAACGRGAVEEVAAPVSYRAPGALIASTTRGGPSDLGGDWVVSQATPGGPVAPGTRVGVTPTGTGAVWRLGGAEVATALTGPGRYSGGGREIWVVWVDDDFRTAAVGTPDGSFGWVMDRPGAASPDRTAAAREMLDFNGYDLARVGG
ncbi:lipocalin family protein [Rubellimicrobium aerolatum]|uniref:Lipocalin family protein n=1 Tax=Rubellimicrobium aerolatum TaxID=490979 RepID=A0ABW0SHY1_9RHOB|nr:lipocalin family protein [Rubellimicrobium aerolatum]MBP1807558.1 apolipoprotein D and lipocalin family protein [Rubellimicrobium aerolatum]